MTIDQNIIEQRIAHFNQVCLNARVKLTRQRLEIFREVARSGDHPDAETVWKSVRQRIPTVSLDTVYRTLWLLNDLGLIKTLGSHYDRTRFDANLSRHHHFICMSCGLTKDFYCETFNDLPVPDDLSLVGAVETLQVEARGICSECAILNKQHKQKPSVKED
jgi:Fur family transcriptional regulator, peroxide stress response regulator